MEQTFDGFQNSRYRNTLTVTGRLPGVYQYFVSNKAKSGMVTAQFTIEGGTACITFYILLLWLYCIICTEGMPLTDITAEQTSLSTVVVMWNAPPVLPAGGYQVRITRESGTSAVNVSGTSHTFSVNNQYGVYSIRVRSLSRHFQLDGTTEPVDYTVRGNSINFEYIHRGVGNRGSSAP